MAGPVSTSVLGYLQRENRPYSLTDIHNNMHREHGKTAIQQALDALVVAGTIRQKDNGKQKIYAAIELDTSNGKNGAAGDAGSLDERLSALKAQVAATQSEISVKQTKATRATQTPSPLTSEASKAVEQLEARVDELRLQVSNAAAAQLDAQQQSANKRQKLSKPVGVEDKEAVLKLKTLRVTEWRRRKRAVNTLIDSILQQDDFRGNREALYDEIGIETDESVGISDSLIP